MENGAADLVRRASELLALAASLPTVDLSDEDACALVVDAEQAGRFIDSIRAIGAAELEDRSRYEFGTAGLSYRLGARRGIHLVEQLTRVSQGEAGRRVRLGLAIRPRVSMHGEVLPAEHPFVATAVIEGRMGADAAAAVIRCLDQAARHHAPLEHLDAAEQALVASAAIKPADEVAVEARVWREALDPDGAEPRDEALRQRRELRIGRERNGMTPFSGQAAPVDAALLRSIFADSTAPASGPRFLSPEDAAAGAQTMSTPDGDIIENIRDPRTREQRQFDALMGLLTAGTRSHEQGPTATIMATVRLEDLENNTGVGWIDDVDQPVPASTINELVCDAGFYRILLGPAHDPLAETLRERFFTPRQRRMLALRDGGCVWPGCTAPPSWCHAHHIVEWSRGGQTEVDNGVLLCPAHHHMLHSSPFTMKMINGRPRLLAPPWIDPDQVWRPLGRSRLRLTRDLAPT